MGRRLRTEDDDEESPSSRRGYQWKKGIQFFKIIHSGIIQDQKLGFPSKFVRKVGNLLSDVAVLKVPNDQVWKVELKKSDRSIWFHNGWQEFVEYHSICAGHFLVFKYIGSSRFDVLIFDMSGTEIQYPCDAHNVEDTNNEGECPMHHENKETKENDDDSVVVLDRHEICTNQEESLQMRVERICWASMTTLIQQKVQKSIEAAQAFKSKYPFYMLVMYSTYIHRDLATVKERFAKIYLPGKKGSLSLTVSGGRTWSVNYCSSSNTSITTGWNKFARENELEVGDVCVFEMINRNDILLKVSVFRNGKIRYKPNVRKGEDPADARECPMPENKETKGDDDDSAVPLDGHGTSRNRDERVQMRSAKIHPCSRSMRMSSSMQQKLLREIEAARAFKSKNPFYMLVMSSKFVRQNYATVKASFSTRYLPDKILGSLTLMVSDGRTWHVNYSSKRSNTNTALTKGWIDFARENKLKEGDVCVFELINRDDLLLKVSIFRNAKKHDRGIADNVEDPNDATECSITRSVEIEDHDSVVLLDGHGTCINEVESVQMRRAKLSSCTMRRTPSINKEKQRAIKAAQAFKSKNPFFMLVMCSTYIRNSQASVKARFATRHLPEEKLGCLTLTVSDGRTWHVNYTSRRSNTMTSMNKGWHKFVRENELKEGDVCVFELINRDDLLLKVSIFRNAKKCDRCVAEDPNYGRQCPVPKKEEIKEDDSVALLDVTPNGHETCTNQEESVGMRLVKRRLCSTSRSSNPSKKRKEQRENEAPRAHKEQKAIQVAEAFKSKNPFYICVMCSTYVRRSYMWVSPNFARKYLSEHKFGSLILTVPDGRTWPVNYISRGNNTYTSLAKGWVTFVKETRLEEGDVCVFELIDRKNLLLKVYIFRDAKISNGSKIQTVEGLNDARKCSMAEEKEIKMKTPNGLEPCTNQEEHDGMRTGKRRLCSTSMKCNPSKKQKEHRASETTRVQKKQIAIEAAGAFKSKNPFYIRVIRSAYLHSSFIWVLPQFAKRYLPENKLGSLTLTVPDGRTWTVNYASRRNNSLTKLTRGWNTFVKENEFEEGDVCVFELVDRKNLLLKVSVFRVANML